MRWPRPSIYLRTAFGAAARPTAAGLAMISLTLAAGDANARRVPSPPRPQPVERDFWRDAIEPHGVEVAKLVAVAREAMKIADDAMQGDAEWAVDQRMRYWQDAYRLLREAHRLSPHNADALAMLGRAADELGRTREAIDAYEACIRERGQERVGADVLGRLGAIYLRLGDRDRAIRWLAQVPSGLRPDTAQPLIHLANALAARGEVSAGIDTLVNALPPASTGYYTTEQTLVTFALATLYDRDEQRSAAFEVLDRLRASLQQQLGPQVQTALAAVRFAPAEDRHYYQALLYEVTEQYVEARAEWALYAAAGETPWRGRALEHVHDIDAKLRAMPSTARTRVPPTPRPIP